MVPAKGIAMSGAQEINGVRSHAVSSVTDTVSVRWPNEKRSVMTNFRLIAAAALSLLLATPAMAMHRGHHHHGYVRSWLPHFDYHSVRGAYAYDRGPGNISSDFDRRNTFN